MAVSVKLNPLTLVKTSLVGSSSSSGLSFAGGSSLDNVNIADSTFLRDMPQKTICMWMFPKSLGVGNIGRLYAKGDGIRFASASRLQYINTFSTSGGSWLTQNNSVKFNQWTHVALTYDTTNVANVPTIYMNGVVSSLSTSTQPVGTKTTDNTFSFVVGNSSPTVGISAFDGYLYEVRFYNRMLSAAEIALIYAGGEPSTSGLLIHWPFSEGSGSRVFDTSGNNQNGTILTATWL